MADAAENGYTADDIQVLKGLEAVRKRPAMYIGDIGVNGQCHNLISTPTQRQKITPFRVNCWLFGVSSYIYLYILVFTRVIVFVYMYHANDMPKVCFGVMNRVF